MGPDRAQYETGMPLWQPGVTADPVDSRSLPYQLHETGCTVDLEGVAGADVTLELVHLVERVDLPSDRCLPTPPDDV